MMSFKMKFSLLILVVITIGSNQVLSAEEVDGAVVKAVRMAFLDLAREKPDMFHPRDVQVVEKNNWWVERFVATSKTEDKALNHMIQVISWRKEFAVNDLSDQYFPIEVHKIGINSFAIELTLANQESH